jgi:hypothetical protein
MDEKGATAGPLLGFLVVEKTANEDGFVSALMVTDNRGYPLEFRATTPIRPSLVQKTLYGGQLEHYVGVELCGKRLVEHSSRKPKIILVPDRRLLDIAPEVEPALLAIWRAGEALKIDDEDAASRARGTINPPGSASQPLVYESRSAGSAPAADAIGYLEDCATRFDLVEPFERMRAALQLLAKEDPRYA